MESLLLHIDIEADLHRIREHLLNLLKEDPVKDLNETRLGQHLQRIASFSSNPQPGTESERAVLLEVDERLEFDQEIPCFEE